VAIRRIPLRLHLEIQHHRRSPVGIIRSSFRVQGKVKHSSHGRLSGLSLDQLKVLQAAFRGDVVLKGSAEDFELIASKEYGASYALLELAKQLGLDRALYSRREAWVQDCLAMIVGRLVYAGSKLALSNQWKNTALWELCGTEGKVDVEEHCYQALDRLLERQGAIQRTLASRHLKEGHLVLYDITSSYFEGAYPQSDIVTLGYNRDGKRGHEQIVIALLCSPEGCPVGVEVFAGNTQDASTVADKIAQLQNQYGLKEIIFVGDRGMITHAVVQKIEGTEGLHTISALTHPQIVQLLRRKVISPELFDEQQIVEVLDPDDLKWRYCLCRNPQTAGRETITRERLLERTRVQLDKIANSRRRASAQRLAVRVGRVLERSKMGKFIQWQVVDGRLSWNFDHDKIAAEKLFDGCYIVSSDMPKEKMAAAQVVASYKKLGLVEEAFRNLKTVQLEIRPVFHKTDDRIKSHVFLCTLAYYLQWHFKQRLEPFFAADRTHKHRQWTLRNVIERLAAIRREKIVMAGVQFEKVTLPQSDQQKILDHLKVRL
jgi:DDE family transposase